MAKQTQFEALLANVKKSGTAPNVSTPVVLSTALLTELHTKASAPVKAGARARKKATSNAKVLHTVVRYTEDTLEVAKRTKDIEMDSKWAWVTPFRAELKNKRLFAASLAGRKITKIRKGAVAKQPQVLSGSRN